MMPTRILSGVKIPRWSAVLVLVGGLLLGALSWSLGVAMLVFGPGRCYWGWAISLRVRIVKGV